MIKRHGIRKAGNAGLVTTTGGNDLLHAIPLTTINGNILPARTFAIRKVNWSNFTGANITFRLGTLNATPVFVPLLPTVLAITGFDGQLREQDLAFVEFNAATVAAMAAVPALAYTGNAYVVASGAGLLITIEVEEFED